MNFSYHSHTQQFIVHLLYHAVNKITYSLKWALDECCWSFSVLIDLFALNFVRIRASKIRNLGTHFLVHLITCLRTWSWNSHFVHLKSLFVQVCTLTCTSPCIYYKDKANVRSIPLTINPEPSLGIQTSFYKERSNWQVSSLPRTKQPDNFLSTMFESSEHGQSFPVFVGLRQRSC